MSRSKRHSRYPDKTYYTVAGWMKRLGLDRAARDIFAWIWSFAVQERWNLASTSEYAAYLDMSELTARNGLRKLTAMGLIVREVYDGDYGPAHKYTVPAEVVTAISQRVAAGDEWGITTLPLKEDKGANDYTPTTNGSLPHTSGSPIYKENSTENKIDNSNTVGAYANASAPVAAAEKPHPVELPLLEDEATDGKMFTDLEQPSAKYHSPRKEKAPGKLTPTEFAEELVNDFRVGQDRAREWAFFRRDERAAFSARALNQIRAALRQLEAEGISADEAVEIALTVDPANGKNKSWQTIVPEWVHNYIARRDRAAAAPAARPAYNQPAPESIMDRRRQRSAEADDLIDIMYK